MMLLTTCSKHSKTSIITVETLGLKSRVTGDRQTEVAADAVRVTVETEDFLVADSAIVLDLVSEITPEEDASPKAVTSRRTILL